MDTLFGEARDRYRAFLEEPAAAKQLEDVLQAGADRILLDNFTVDEIRQAVALTEQRAELEASGGITLDNLRQYAETGVDYISIGALSKHIHAIDFSMRFD